MATTTEVPTGVQMIDVERIGIPGNVRELDADHVDALAGSIKLRGLRVPVIVRPDEKGYELVAGFHRFAAHKQLGLTQIRAEIQANADAHVDRGLENIARKQLNAYEPSGIALDASFGRSDDTIASEFGRFRARPSGR